MFVLKHAIIHSFTKEAHTDIIGNVVKKDIVLDTENRALIALAQGINGLIGTTGNSVVYGQFSNDGRQGPFLLPLMRTPANCLTLLHFFCSHIS